MTEKLVDILAAIKSAPKDIRRVILFDADKEIEKHKKLIEEVRSGKHKIPSAADEYRVK